MVEIKKLNETAIGVFTDSEEEANEIMEIIEKLEAWKRLRDKRFERVFIDDRFLKMKGFIKGGEE